MSEIKITKRNLITGILVLVVVLFVWQVYELFWGANLPQDISRPQSVAAPEKPLASTTILPATASTLSGAQAANAAANGQLPPPPVNTASDDNSGSAGVDPNSDAQTEYLKLVNQYQMAQLQRMIAEDNEAIAVARRNAAQAMSDTTKLAGDGSVPISATSDSSGVSGYELVYTGQQNDGSWTATLKKDGQTFDVDAGKLMPDGSQVISVDENGVLISQNNGAVKKLVTFSGEVVLGASSSGNNTANIDQSLVKSTPPEDTDSIAATTPETQGDSDQSSSVNAMNSDDQSSDASITATPVTVSAQAKPSNTVTAQAAGNSVKSAVPSNELAATTNIINTTSNNKLAAANSTPTVNNKLAVVSSTAVIASPRANANPVKTSNTATGIVQTAVASNSVKLASLEKKAESDDQDTSVFSKLSDMMQTGQVQPTKSTIAIASAISPAPKTVAAASATTQAAPAKPTVVSVDPATQTTAPKIVVAPVKPVATPVKSAVANPPAAPAAKTVEADATNNVSVATTESDKDILAENPNHFTIQLTTDHELASVLDFINRHHLQGQATYFQAYNRHGEKLFVLVQGHFANEADAEQAIQRLPASVRVEGAFAQSYASIQGMIRKA